MGSPQGRFREPWVLLLLALGVTAVNAGEPSVVLGAGGAITCKEYVALLKDQHKPQAISVILSWVQGYFSARNTAGRVHDPLTVGGTMSGATLQAMLADECREENLQPLPVVIAVGKLYDKLQEKGL